MAKVFLSAGHGGVDSGAVAYGLMEKTINLNIMLACRNVLTAHNITVVCSRTTDENDPVQQEVKEANSCNANVAVSFHTNAGRGDGSESYYYPTSANGKKLAQLCEKRVQELGQNSRGVKTKDLAFVRDTKMVSVLCECAFIDNDKDNDIIDTLEEQQAFGVAYAKAILEYLGITYVGVNNPPVQVPEHKPVTPQKPTEQNDDIAEDGVFGCSSIKKGQKCFKTTVDGIVSRQPLCNKKYFIAIDARYWKFTDNYKGGSWFIKELQEVLKVNGFYNGKIDGLMGENTIIALQQFLSMKGLYTGKIDRYFGYKTALGLQKYFNRY